jgi:hypothetical protein
MLVLEVADVLYAWPSAANALVGSGCGDGLEAVVYDALSRNALGLGPDPAKLPCDVGGADALRFSVPCSVLLPAFLFLLQLVEGERGGGGRLPVIQGSNSANPTTPRPRLLDDRERFPLYLALPLCPAPVEMERDQAGRLLNPSGLE